MSSGVSATEAPFVLVRQHFGCTVFDRSTSRYLPFDAEATKLLQRSVNTPYPALISKMTNAGRKEQAAEFFYHFYDMGFFTLDGLFAGAILDMPPAPDHLTGPLAVHLEVVAACNLACTHCFAGSLPRKEKPLSLNELDTLFASMARLGSFRLGLTGGEPLLRRDIFEIIDLAASHGLHPCLTTNALLITEDIARELGRRKMVWINVSLEGAAPEVNDPIRGIGTFDRVLDKLKVLGRHARFTLAFTVMRTNAGQVEACARLAERVGASAAVFRPLYPVGSARSHLEKLMPTYAQYDAALASLCGLAEGKARIIDPFSPRLRQETRAVTNRNFGCGAGSSVCSISVSGNVSPCSFLGAGFVAANVRERPLEEIWREGHTFREIRSLPGGTTDTFSGGCRARSLVLNGSANAPDPWMAEREEASRKSPVTFYHPGAIMNLLQASEGGA